jgi:probable rRNA maturation factor
MAQVNGQFLQHEGPTDVITFDLSEGGVGPLAGEIFVCPVVAVRQAREFGTDWQTETVRYVAHGILHLLGYDDLEPAKRRVMKQAEGRIVRRLQKQFSLDLLALSPTQKV